MAAFLQVAVLLFLLVTGTTAGGYGGQTTPTPSTSTPASYTPTPAMTPSPYTLQPAKLAKPAHDYDGDNNKLAAGVRVVVEGQALCQSCEKQGLDGAAPLPKAQVMVTCHDRKDGVMLHRSMPVADSKGYYHAEFGVERADTDMACFVRLLSSPDPKCNMDSDFHHCDEGKHWIDGRGLRNVVYTTRTLAFRPQKCVPPYHH